jgi:hypothetical protein
MPITGNYLPPFQYQQNMPGNAIYGIGAQQAIVEP